MPAIVLDFLRLTWRPTGRQLGRLVGSLIPLDSDWTGDPLDADLLAPLLQRSGCCVGLDGQTLTGPRLRVS